MAKSNDLSSLLDVIQKNLQKYGASSLVKIQLREAINELEKAQRKTEKYGSKQKAIEKVKYGSSLSTQIDDLKQALSDVIQAGKTKDTSKIAQARGLVNVTLHKEKSVSTYFKRRTIKQVSTGRKVKTIFSGDADETLRRMFHKGMHLGLDKSHLDKFDSILKKYGFGISDMLKEAIENQYKNWQSDLAQQEIKDTIIPKISNALNDGIIQDSDREKVFEIIEYLKTNVGD